MKNALPLLLIIIFALPLSSFGEDVVQMKNGEVYRGKVTEVLMNEYVQIQLNDGNQKRLSSSDIEKMDLEKDTLNAAQPGGTVREATNGSKLVEAGLVSFGVSYAATIAVGLSLNASPLLYIPVLGPFVSIPETKSKYLGLSMLSGAVQTLGLGLAVAGFRNNNENPRGNVTGAGVTERRIELHPGFSADGNLTAALSIPF